MNDEIRLRVPWGLDTKVLLISILIGIGAAFFVGMTLGIIGKGTAKTDEGKPVEIVVR